jgi:hypothetical protein
MSASHPDAPAHGVDWLRGSRDYVRIADVLAVAPISTGNEKLELRFHAATNCPGRWMPSEAAAGPRSGKQVVATLKITDAQGARKWDFVVDTSSPITKRLPDLGEDRLTAAVSVVDGRTSLTMLGQYDVWEHIIASAKALGAVLYPGVQWYVLYLKADLGAIPQATAGCVMNAQRTRTRMGVDEVTFSIDGASIGLLWACDRAG